MKITDPSLCPDDFGPVTFETVDDDPRGPEVFDLVVDGASVGELAPLRFANLEVLAVDDHGTCVRPGSGCWGLELVEEDGRLAGTHVLFAAQRDEADDGPLSGELAVWATLMAIWTFTDRDRQRG